MTFLLLNLLQPRTPLPWFVIVAAVLVFAGCVSLFVYFFRRYKKIEKEPEEDWDMSRRSIFVSAPPAPGPKVEESDTPASVEAEQPVAQEAPVQAGGTREFASDLTFPSFAPTTPVEPEPHVEPPELEERIQPETAAPPAEAHQTEILASPSIEQPTAETEQAGAPFDEEIWDGLEIAEPLPLASEHHAPGPPSVARVDQPAPREPFEAPRIERISRREPYEPPTIEPLTPREAAATRELRSAQSPGIKHAGLENPEERTARGTIRFGSVSSDTQSPLEPQRSKRELAGELVAATPLTLPEKSISAGVAPRGRSFGSILGLPAESSHQPLILGEPVRPVDETGIGALTHYGQDLGPKGGRAGTIALFIVVALLCGAAGLYFFVPSIHTQVSEFIARLRGTQTEDRDALKPKAQIMPSSRPEVNKNMVIARGAVDNISDEPLVNLEVEVSLQRGSDAPPEIRRIPVTPDTVPQGERGTFEFEYDGKRDTGFAGYTITRLFSNGTEVRFRTPAQK